MKFPVTKTDAEWRQELTTGTISRAASGRHGAAVTGKYWNTREPGVYRCAACEEIIFTSDTKFDSGCGWPSFYDLAAEKKSCCATTTAWACTARRCYVRIAAVISATFSTTARSPPACAIA